MQEHIAKSVRGACGALLLAAPPMVFDHPMTMNGGKECVQTGSSNLGADTWMESVPAGMNNLPGTSNLFAAAANGAAAYRI